MTAPATGTKNIFFQHPAESPGLQQSITELVAGAGKIDVNELGSRMAAMIVEAAVKDGASDIHFDPIGDAVTVRFRIDGQLRDQMVYSNTEFPITARLRVMANFPPRAATYFTPEDGRFQCTLDGRNIQFRVSSFPVLHGEKLVLRLLNLVQGAFNFETLGMSPDIMAKVKTLIQSPSGMMVVAGLTGSGKTTTLCGILRNLSREEINIMTLEDPVEYIIPRVTHSQINPKAGFTFAEGLRCILRQDPNIIMVGEVRDLETAEIAMRAAMTGHMIFCTVHATTAVGVVHRFISMGIEPYIITEVFTGALAQRLVRKVCPHCAEPAGKTLKPAAIESLLTQAGTPEAKALREILNAPGANYLRGKGCEACRGTGYKGRVGIFEFLTVNDDLRQLISQKADIVELRRSVHAAGLKTLLQDAIEKIRAGVTTIEEVGRVITE